MKKLFYYLLLASAMLTWTSCSFDNDDNPVIPELPDNPVIPEQPDEPDVQEPPTVEDIWNDFTDLIGKDKTTVDNYLKGLNYEFISTDYSESKDGTDYYSAPADDYLEFVAFVYNTEKHICEYWVYPKNFEQETGKIKEFLSQKYIQDGNDYFNEDKTIKITVDESLSAVGYISQTLPTYESDSFTLPDFTAAIGMGHNELIAAFGNPLLDDDSGIWYFQPNQFVQSAIFRADLETGKICDYYLSLATTDVEVVVKYLSSLYVVYEKGTKDDGSMYAWTNEEGTIGIIYAPSQDLIRFLDIRK